MRWMPPGKRSTVPGQGDMVVLCVDYATEVYKELEKRRGSATPAALGASESGLIEAVGGDPDLIDLSSLPR